jgi:GT2 family glycosyltransferase
MKLVVVIPTFGRREQVARLVAFLALQSRPPDEVLVSTPDAAHVAWPEASPFPVRAVFGPTGLCAQRNTALDDLGTRFDVITFLDDDFVPAEDYLAGVAEAFAANPDFAVVMGRVLRDGATNAGLDWPEALAALEAPEPGPPPRALVDHVGAYGCNMSIRAGMIGGMRFDERLVLYGWQEDIDFTSRLRARGRVVCVARLRGVHLGLKAGRVSGERFGYSQVVNPLYLIRKRSVPAGFALRLMARNLAANLARSLRPEPYVDRRGRLRGNLLALAHVLRGRIEPEHVLRL